MSQSLEMGYLEGSEKLPLEASSTYINEYMEENESLLHLYDFGDSWEHKVEVEEVLKGITL